MIDKRCLPWSKDDPRRIALAERNRKLWTGRKHSPKTVVKMRRVQSKAPWKKGRPSSVWTDEQKERVRNRLLGRKHSPKTIAKIRSRRSKDILAHKKNCGCWVHGPKSPTSLEFSLRTLLSEFPEVIEQKRFGRYRVDAYLPPPYHLAFEADGSYWHTLPGRKESDNIRDNILLKQFNLPVIHLTERDLLGVVDVQN